MKEIAATTTPAVRQWRIEFKVGRRSAQTWDQFTHDHNEFDQTRFVANTAGAYFVAPSDVVVLSVREMM